MKAMRRQLSKPKPTPHRARVEMHPSEKPPAEHSICRSCGSVYARKEWRSSNLSRDTPVSGVTLTTCPACRQVARGEGKGHLVIRGSFDASTLDAIRRRILNVAARARFTQPERRLVTMEARGRELEVITTSQELAHRIAREIEKAFGARASYIWSGQGERELRIMCELNA